MMVPRALAAALAAVSFSPLALAQDPVVQTDEETGIEFVTWTQDADSSFTFGIALPPTALEEDADEYIGLLRCASSAADKKGWCGFSHGAAGQMTQALLIVAWPYEDQVLTSFRFADGYSMPPEYTGNATLTQIRSKVDDDGYEVLYRCQGCFSWDQDGVASSVSTSQGYIVAGRAQGNVVPENPGCPSEITFAFHDDGFGQSGLPLDDAPSESYEEWAALASNTVTGSCGGDSEEPPADEDDPPASTGDGDAEPTDAPEEEPEAPEETSGEGESQSPQSPSQSSTAPSRDSGNPTTADRQSWQDQSDFGSSRPSWLVDDDDDVPWWEEYISRGEEEDTPWWEDYISGDDEDDTPWWEDYISGDDEDDTPWWEDYVSGDDEDDTPWWLDRGEDEGDEDQDQEDEFQWPTFWPRPEEPTEGENTRPPRPTPTSDEEETSQTSETSPTGGVNTRPTREPRPTPTFGPGPDEPSEGTDEPSETESPSGGENTRPTRPPRPTPTFWPDPWEPNEPSETSEVEEPTEEPSDEPSETSEVEEPTEEPSDEPSETSEVEEPTEEPSEPEETSEVEEPTEEPSDEPEETSEVEEPTEEPSDEPEETAVPSETPSVSFEIGSPEPSQPSDSESPVETEVPEESVTEEPEPSETETEVPEESAPVETETDTPEEEPTETETDEPEEEPVETEAPEPPEDVTCNVVDEDETFDYIVIGAGAGGIPVAERLTAAGHKVLLLEKGPPSSARWGGDMKPEWLEGEDLTRFDVPGLCNQIWHDSTGIVCTDMDQIAGCVLGGGTAVNAGLWWKPHPDDWDVNFPAGWHSEDVEGATNRVFTRIPGTTHPSMDGQLYEQEGYDVLANGLEAAGWELLNEPNSSPDKKNRTFGHTTFMFAGGERGGPLATYLVTASRNENFSLWTDTAVRRLVREGGRITGVELENCTNADGHSGTIKVPSHGRVILSAGTFGSAKLLLRSGIGPRDQLEFVAGSALDGETMIAEADWIELPVGENLMDHLNTDVVVEHEDVVQYNYTDAWYNPIEADKEMYLRDRSGILAAAAPNIGPMIWDDITVSDGTTRQLQWTCRMEGSLDLMGNHTITMSQYLGRGVVSRGRMALTPALTTRVQTLPYLTGDEGDLEAIIQGLDNIREALADVPGLKFLSPADNVTSAEYVDQMLVSVARRSNHWLGTNKIGEDDGRDGGEAVVDTNTQVYGMDNLFVVDGSIMPGMMTGNPSAMIVIMAEHAADKILALEAPAAEEPSDEEEPSETEEPAAEPSEPTEEEPAEEPAEEEPAPEEPVEEAPVEEAPVDEGEE